MCGRFGFWADQHQVQNRFRLQETLPLTRRSRLWDRVQPGPDDLLEIFAVSTKVNNPRNDEAALVKPIHTRRTGKTMAGKTTNMPSPAELTQAVIQKAKALGASVAGVARVEALKGSPSHLIHPKIGMNLDVPWQGIQENKGASELAWPGGAVSAVVIGVAHPADDPGLDWWDGKGTPGNRILIRINQDLARWTEETFGCTASKLPYLIEKGGIFLKDAAVMAGLGCVGKNNLVITPDYGPRIRFRALLLDLEAEATGPLEFRPCENCKQPCRTACPVNAFAKNIYSGRELSQSRLPGSDGTYDRVTCNRKMEQDIEDAVAAMRAGHDDHQDVLRSIAEFEEEAKKVPKNEPGSQSCVKYCRECELSCPVGTSRARRPCP